MADKSQVTHLYSKLHRWLINTVSADVRRPPAGVRIISSSNYPDGIPQDLFKKTNLFLWCGNTRLCVQPEMCKLDDIKGTISSLKFKSIAERLSALLKVYFNQINNYMTYFIFVYLIQMYPIVF